MQLPKRLSGLKRIRQIKKKTTLGTILKPNCY
ncbi:MAG: hypothetical protein ACI9CZ_001165, partial [Flavobacterium sp.]